MSPLQTSEDREIGPRPIYELATWGRRLGAQLMDMLINLIPGVALFVFLNAVSSTHGHFLLHAFYTQASGEHHEYGLNPPGLAIWVGLISLYWGVLMGRRGRENGQTVGMRRLGIRVVADDGRELTGGRAIIRFVLMVVMWLAFVIPGVIDCLWPLWERESRALHDLICRTHVVQTESLSRTWSP